MEAGLLVQYVLVGIAVAASAAYVFASRLPRQARAARLWLALRLLGTRQPLLQAVARRIAPGSRAAGSCGTCNSCDPG